MYGISCRAHETKWKEPAAKVGPIRWAAECSLTLAVATALAVFRHRRAVQHEMPRYERNA